MSQDSSEDGQYDYDVVVVGGGPAGSSAGVFTARYGLETAIFDRGRSSLKYCAYLENYLGFPAGIDIETFYGLMHDHAVEAGCDLVSDLVESVTRTDDQTGFIVEPQEGEPVTAARVIAATRYDGEYLRPLGGDEMFERREYDGEEQEFFDRSYAETDGKTPIMGLYVASPSTEADRQVVLAAGLGARVGLAVIDDVRREQGYFEGLAAHRDWMRRESGLTGDWQSRDRWRKWAEDKRPDELEIDEDDWLSLREEAVDRRLETFLSEEEITNRTERGQDRLLEHIDDDRIIEYARELESDREVPQDSAETEISSNNAERNQPLND